jgi:hypothetical protein
MGILIAYNAAMQRVLIGLEAQEVFESDEGRSSQEEEDPCSQDENAPAGGEARRRRASLRERLSLLSARLKTECGASIAPEDLTAKCIGPEGEFYKNALAVFDAVNQRCSRSGDYAPLDEYDEAEVYAATVRSAARRFAAGGVSAADLKRPKTLENMILAAAHRIATRMRAAAVRKP